MAKIMLVDDDPTMLMLLETLLEMEGYTVKKWDGKSDVVEQARQYQPDLMLLDVNLSSLNGFDVLADIKKNPDLNNTSIIMSSGMDYRNRCLMEGAEDFLMKPYMPDDLINLIRNYLN